jgi:hypothetical protein
MVAGDGNVSPQEFTALIFICLVGATEGVPVHGANG